MNQTLPTLRVPDVSHVLAVASGKGGVGKTTVAVNLALALRQDGARVGLFDADLYGPNVPLMLGVRRERPASGYVPVFRADSTPYIPPLERFGLKVMSMGFVVSDADTVRPDPFFAGHIIRQTLQDVISMPGIRSCKPRPKRSRRGYSGTSPPRYSTSLAKRNERRDKPCWPK